MAMANGRICVVNEALDVGEWQEAEGPIAGMCEVISQRCVTNTVVNVALVHPLANVHNDCYNNSRFWYSWANCSNMVFRAFKDTR